MDYFNEAFGGGGHPDHDQDAALKFSLCVIALDKRMDELLRLIGGSGDVGGVEGDPGWIIECRDDEDVIGYEKWPSEAQFRAYVAPEAYLMTYPEFYADRKTFFRYVASLVDAYKRRNPEQVGLVSDIEAVLGG